MRFINYRIENDEGLAVETDQGVLKVKDLNLDTTFNSTDELIKYPDRNQWIADLKEKLTSFDFNKCYQPHHLEYRPAVINPEKILCVGLNYMSHVEESGFDEAPADPVIFSKFNNALAGHNEEIPLPTEGEQFDYEAELVLVIGKEGKNISEEDALSHVFGYTIANELSVRDLQFKTSQWLIGKSADKFAPVGPAIVTSDEINPDKLNISLNRNGETVQASNTDHMLFSCAQIIAYISRYMTLVPGDIIFTGTPEGVVLGQEESKRNWLQPGDHLEVAIENIGVLSNTII